MKNKQSIDLLFIGSVIPANELGTYSGFSVAGNKMQLGLLNGMANIQDVKSLEIISYYPVASFPKERKIIFRCKLFPIGNLKIISIPFINLPFIKIFSQQLSILISIAYSLIQGRLKNKIILTYNAYIEISWPALVMAKLFKIPIFCLLADLPIPSVKYNGLNGKLAGLFFKSTKIAITKYNGLLVLNKNAQKLFAPNLPFITIHGGIDTNDYLHLDKKNESKKSPQKIKTILYVGALIEYNGIESMLKAFNKVGNDDVNLVIYGSGPLQSLVESYAAKDKRIIYKGQTDNESLLTIQKHSDFLINPRPVDSYISNVTFPSKIFEYWLSGTPILSTRLECLTEDFSSYLNFVSDNPENMALDINSYLQMDYSLLKTKAEKARKIISTDFNWTKQAEWIVNFMINPNSEMDKI